MTFRSRAILVGVMVVALGMVVIGFDLWRSYTRAIHEAERATRNLTIALEAHTNRSIQAVDFALAALAIRLRDAAMGRELKAGRTGTDVARPPNISALIGADDAGGVDMLMRADMASLPQVMWISAFDPLGRPLASTDRSTAGRAFNAGRADYFTVLRSDDFRSKGYISAPFKGRATGRWEFVISHPIVDADGEFAGAVVAAIEPRYFPDLYRNIDIGEHGNVTLFHQNGTVVARWPNHEEFAGRSAAAGALFREQLPKADSGTARTKTVLQGTDILYSYRRVGGLIGNSDAVADLHSPLVINVAFEMGDVLSDWRNSLIDYAVLATGLVLLVGIAVFVTVRAQRRAEEARQWSEATFRALFDNASEGILVVEPVTGRLHSSNPAIRRMLGYTESELSQLRPLAIHPRDQRAYMREQFTAIGRGELRDLSAVPTVRKDGEVFYADISAFRFQFGRKTYLAGLFRDVTALKLSQERLTEAQRIAQIGSWEIDHVSGAFAWSDQILRLYEIDASVPGPTIESFIAATHPADRVALQETFRGSLNTREPYGITHRVLMPDGRVKHMHVRCETEFDARGRAVRSRGTVQDVTPQKLAEQDLLVSHAAIESSINGVAMSGLDGLITYVNRAFIEMWRLAGPEQALGRPAQGFVRGDAVMAEAMRRDGRAQGELTGLRPDGTAMPLQITAYIVKSAAGSPLCVMASFIDISDRKHAEEALRQLNEDLENRVLARTAELQSAVREIETFSYSAAHDLRAPLRGISGYSELLLRDHGAVLDDEGRGFLGKIIRATEHMSHLIDDLLAYSRLERRNMVSGVVELPRLAGTLLAECADEIAARGVLVNVKVECGPVNVDADGLAMALRNLIENALKFTRDVPHPALEIGGRDTGSSRLMWVRDNGVGFEMKYHDRIFDIFQRLHQSDEYPGTGVGLAIVRKAMERLGGRVWAESEPRKGATFFLEIPA